MLIPVADLLLVELRHCVCGNSYEAPSPHIHRLFRSPSGELFKQVIVCRENDDIPLAITTVYKIKVPIPACENCWLLSHSWPATAAIIPERPRPAPIFSGAGQKTEPKRSIPFNIDQL